MAKDLLLGSKAQLQNIQAAGSPGRTCRMGTKRGNIRGCARPPGESAPRLTLASCLSQEGNWGGCALPLHEFSLWRGVTGQGEQPREERHLLLHEGTRQDFLGGRGPQFLPLEGRPLPSWPPGSSHPPKPASTEAGRRLTFVRQELEGREGSPGRGQERERRAPALKHLALSSGAQGNLSPWASAFLGARSGESAAVARSPLRF